MLWRIWLVTLAFLAVTAARSRMVDIPIRDPGGAFLIRRLAITFVLFVAFAFVEAVLRTPTGRRRPTAIWTTARKRWTNRRMAAAWAALAAYHVVYLSYHNLKSWDVLNRPRDPTLTRLDQWLFLSAYAVTATTARGCARVGSATPGPAHMAHILGRPTCSPPDWSGPDLRARECSDARTTPR